METIEKDIQTISEFVEKNSEKGISFYKEENGYNNVAEWENILLEDKILLLSNYNERMKDIPLIKVEKNIFGEKEISSVSQKVFYGNYLNAIMKEGGEQQFFFKVFGENFGNYLAEIADKIRNNQIRNTTEKDIIRLNKAKEIDIKQGQIFVEGEDELEIYHIETGEDPICFLRSTSFHTDKQMFILYGTEKKMYKSDIINALEEGHLREKEIPQITMDDKTKNVLEFLEKYPNYGISFEVDYFEGEGISKNKEILLFKDTTDSFFENDSVKRIVLSVDEITESIKKNGDTKGIERFNVDWVNDRIEKGKCRETTKEQELHSRKIKDISDYATLMLMDSLDREALEYLEKQYNSLTDKDKEKVINDSIKNYLSEIGEVEEKILSKGEEKIITDIALRRFNFITKTENTYAYVIYGEEAVEITNRIFPNNLEDKSLMLDISDTAIKGILKTNVNYIDCSGSNISEINGVGTKEIKCDNCENLKIIWAHSCEKVSAENTPLLAVENIYAKDNVEIFGKEIEKKHQLKR